MSRPGVEIRSRAVAVHLIRPTAVEPEVLLMRRTGTLAGAWYSVAGRIEAGETAWQAALREVREETGLRPERFYTGDIVDQFYVAAYNIISLLPVFVGFVTAGAEVVLNDEHDMAEWLTFDDAIERITFAAQRRVLRHVREEFIEREPNELLRIKLPAG